MTTQQMFLSVAAVAVLLGAGCSKPAGQARYTPSAPQQQPVYRVQPRPQVDPEQRYRDAQADALQRQAEIEARRYEARVRQEQADWNRQRREQDAEAHRRRMQGGY